MFFDSKAFRVKDSFLFLSFFHFKLTRMSKLQTTLLIVHAEMKQDLVGSSWVQILSLSLIFLFLRFIHPPCPSLRSKRQIQAVAIQEGEQLQNWGTTPTHIYYNVNDVSPVIFSCRARAHINQHSCN